MMRKFLLLCLLAVPAMAAPALAASKNSFDDASTKVIHVSAGSSTQRITLGLNKAVVIDLDREVGAIDVASPEIADAVVKSPHQVLLIAAKLGQTNAFFTDHNGLTNSTGQNQHGCTLLRN